MRAEDCTCIDGCDLRDEPIAGRPGEFYSRLIAVEIQGMYDGVSEWLCPDCGVRWDRFTGERLVTLPVPTDGENVES